MLRLYAVQFNVLTAGIPQSETSPALKNTISQWIREKLTEFSSEFLSPGIYTIAGSHHIVIDEETIPNGSAESWSLEWDHPDEKDAKMQWHTVCEIARFATDVEFSLTVSLQSELDSFTITHLDLRDFTLGRPRVIPKILALYTCTNNGRHLTASPNLLDRNQVEDFVKKTLLSSERHLPVVLFSIDPYNGNPVGYPKIVADRLAGLAEIYVLSDVPSSFDLSKQLGKTLSCYNGAARIYYPGFNLHSEFRECPVFMKEDVLFFPNEAGFANSLLRRLSSTAAIRFAPGKTALAVRKVMQENRTQIQAQREAEFEQHRKDALEKRDIEELFNSTDLELTHYKNSNIELSETIERLRVELDTAYTNLQALSLWSNPEQVEDSLATAPPEEYTVFHSVEEAVSKAQEDFSETLYFVKRALKTAQDSPYGQPDRAYEALKAMHEVCLTRRIASKTGEPLGALEDVFKSKGFSYIGHVAQTSLGQHGEEYKVIYEGASKSIEEHLAIGKGGPVTCLRIHFFWDKTKEMFVIGHVGRHPTNTKT